MSIAILTAAVRRLIAAEAARYVAPNSAKANESYAQAWAAAVRARGGDSRGLSRVSHYGALRLITQLAVGLSQGPANDNAFPIDPELLQKCDNDRDLAIEQIDRDVCEESSEQDDREEWRREYHDMIERDFRRLGLR